MAIPHYHSDYDFGSHFYFVKELFIDRKQVILYLKLEL